MPHSLTLFFAAEEFYEPVTRIFVQFWYVILVLAVTLFALYAAVHVALNKRDVRAAIGWIGIIMLVPLVGTILYFLLGINRIQRRANKVFGSRKRVESNNHDQWVDENHLVGHLPLDSQHLLSLYRLVQRVSRRPLLSGNKVEPLNGGDAAYPVMLEAIGKAQGSISLCTYIFDDDPVGREFLAALKAAKERGVEVRILVDAVGARYSYPPIHQTMYEAGLEVEIFNPSRVPWKWAYANLRNHRKLLIVDGKIGFTGGMNIREGTQLSRNPSHPIQDLHFRIQGPVVAELQESFCEDWTFATGNTIEGPLWFPPLPPVGNSSCRALSDGPDEDFEHIRWAILGAIASAERSVRVITPYFLPDAATISALNVAAMRGLKVEILVPAHNNLNLVQWASTAHFGQLLAGGCRIFETPSPFDHTKLMIVDGAWVMLGSANWDPRSLRLNFELNVECYDSELATQLEQLFLEKRQRSHEVTKEENKGRPMSQRVRNGFARLLSPYL